MQAGAKTLIFTIVAAAAVYFAGNGRVQLFDRDEPRYAQCSRQMLESGDWVVPKLYDEPRTKKPPLIYWCQASAMKVLGRDGDAETFAFAARVPSALAMVATLLALGLVLWRQSGPGQASWTVFIFASSGLAIVAAKICLTDSVLIFFITIAQFCLYAIWRGNRSWAVMILLGVMFGLGVMIKGPFIFGIVGTTAAALAAFHWIDKWIERRRLTSAGLSGSLSPVLGGEGWGEGPSGKERFSPSGPSPQPSPPSTGEREPEREREPDRPSLQRNIAQILVIALIVIAIVAPWVVMIYNRSPDFLKAMFKEGLQHAGGGKEGHTFPPGYHLLLVWPMFMPWSLMLPLAIGMGIRHRKIPEIRFALAAVLGPWLMVEFIGTKLPHYFLPAYPALAYLTAFGIRRCMSGEAKDLESRPFRIAAGVWAVAIIAVGALPWLAAKSFASPGNPGVRIWFRPLPWQAMIAVSGSCLLVGAGIFALIYTRRFKAAFVSMGVGMLAVIALTWTCYFPNADFLRISMHAAEVLRERGPVHPGDAKMVDYKEPSLAFYQGGTIREVEKKSELLTKPFSEWPRFVVITREAWNQIVGSGAPEWGRFSFSTGEGPEIRETADRCRLHILDSYHGWAYADQGRIVELLVIEKSVY